MPENMGAGMTKMRYMLDEDFEADGRWWLPDRPDEWRYGTILFSQRDLKLKIHGSLESKETVQAEAGVWRRDFRRFDTIYGVLNDGKRVTLLKCRAQGGTSDMQEALISIYGAIYGVVGHHCQPFDEQRFTDWRFNCNRLDDFTANLTITWDERTNEVGDFSGIGVDHTAPPKQLYESQCTDAKWQFESELWFKTKIGKPKVSMRGVPVVNVQPNQPQTIDWFVKQMYHFCGLLCLFMDQRILPRWVRCSIGEEATCWLLFPNGYTKEESERETLGADFPLFVLPDFGEGYGSKLEKWMSAPEMLRNAIHLFLDARFSEGDSDQGRFLTAMRSLETVSRATQPGLYMKKEDYADVQTALVDAIPKSLSGPHRSSLESKIEYGNELSQRVRIVSLLESLTPELLNCVCVSLVKFKNGIVLTRNYLTHYSEKDRSVALRGGELIWARDKIIMLIRILLLMHLDLPQEKIAARISNHPRFMQQKWIWKEVREC
ncbi:ApeA N-terminal domain 1-containing protein [Anatilimnocola floriformis]|uniref:ApeA N-terminal domain 1-containing protein n=1 Tax=Anatilimnocola floriformis TaxID=2948575 RepID=UPI0020C408E3|nr:HEPN domain-containing protein [Anatilimnocola floriformis]